MREVQGRRVRRNAQMYKPLTQNIWAGCLGWYFDLRIIPGISHKLKLFWAGPYTDSSSLGRDQTGVLSKRRKTGESRHIVTILGKRRDSPESWSYRSGLMVRQRRNDGATKDTLSGGGGKGQRTITRPERAVVISWTRPSQSNSPWRSPSDSWKRRNTQENPVGYSTPRQRGRGGVGSDVRSYT